MKGAQRLKEQNTNGKNKLYFAWASEVEFSIQYANANHRMRRNFLSGVQGDAMTRILAGLAATSAD